MEETREKSLISERDLRSLSSLGVLISVLVFDSPKRILLPVEWMFHRSETIHFLK